MKQMVQLDIKKRKQREKATQNLAVIMAHGLSLLSSCKFVAARSAFAKALHSKHKLSEIIVSVSVDTHI